jgi:hypothetical protein
LASNSRTYSWASVPYSRLPACLACHRWGAKQHQRAEQQQLHEDDEDDHLDLN